MSKVSTLTVDVAFHGQQKEQELPTSRAYLFDRMGKYIESSLLGKGPIKFKIEPNKVYRVTVGPDLISQQDKIPANLVAQLGKAKSITKDYSPQLGVDELYFSIHPSIWTCWWQTCINVHGSVRKLINPGGTKLAYTPICTGTVQIFQVDLACTLDRLASFQLAILRDKLYEALKSLSSTRPSTTAAGIGIPDNIKSRLAVGQQQLMSTSELAASILGSEETVLKRFIVANKRCLWPYLCGLIPDDWFCWQELGEAPIQSDGTFSAEICFWCPRDFPDLYFEVIQNVDGVEREISDPQIACSTYYDYDGSSDVLINVEDPAAVGCNPPPSAGPGYLYVWPTAIGNVDLGQIDGLETPFMGNGTIGTTTEPVPWGGNLSLQMQFHPDLQNNNIKYYRWSYKFDDELDFTPIKSTVIHRYQTVTVTPGPPLVIQIHLNSVALGPNIISGPGNPGGTPNLFAIPDPLLPWINISDPSDRPFAYFDSTTTGGSAPRKSGKCTLMLELFDGDGKFVPCNNTRGSSSLGDESSDPAGPGTFTYILPEIGGPPDTYTNAPQPNITDHGRLIFRILVDNNSTDAELQRVRSPSGSADICGFLHYKELTDNISIDYVAFHPNNFLDWSLGISRGLAGPVASTGGNMSAGSPPPGLPASFTKSAGDLLGKCTRAAFAVNLYCAARATNGYGRQSQYDSSATIAFALTTT